MAELEFELGEEFSFTTHMMSGAVAGYFEVNCEIIFGSGKFLLKLRCIRHLVNLVEITF